MTFFYASPLNLLPLIFSCEKLNIFGTRYLTLLKASLFFKSSKAGCAIISTAVRLFLGLYINILLIKSIISGEQLCKTSAKFLALITL